MFKKVFWGLAVMGVLALGGCGGGGSSGGAQTVPAPTPIQTPVVTAGENLFVSSNDAAYAARVTVINLATSAVRKFSEIQGVNSSCWSIAYDPITLRVLVRCSQTTGTTGNLPYWWYDPAGNTVTNVSFPAVTPRLVNSSTSTVTVGNNIWMAEGLVSGPSTANTDISVLVNNAGTVSVSKITLPTVNGYVTRLQVSSDKLSVFALTSNGDVHKLAVGTPPTLSYTIPNTGSASNFLVTGGKVYVVNSQEVKVYSEATGVADALEPTISVAGIGPAVPTMFAIGFNGTDLVLAGNEGVWGYTLTSKVLAFYALDAAATYREVAILANGDALLLENKGASATKVLRSPKSTPRITTEVSNIPGTIRLQVLTY
jgi:hypothetical protein